MKLENQVASLDLAKRLKELGVKQESLFYHWATAIEQDGLAWWNVSEKEPRKGKPVRAYLDSVGRPSVLSAFTVAELGEMLPDKVGEKKIFNWKGILDGKTDWYAGVMNERAWVEANTEANARAKMLIYLLENKLISSSVSQS